MYCNSSWSYIGFGISVFNEFLERWTSFFERSGTEGLSANRQRGLFGELFWLDKMIVSGISSYIALNSWKGCQRSFHDFEINGMVVEVKSTMTKNPVKVTINNEVKYIKESETAYIPTGAVHRLENDSESDLIVIEVQTGSYFGEDDIVRIQDDYNR